MKTTTKFLALSLVGLTLITISCKKDKTVTPIEEPTPSQPVFNNTKVQSLFNALATPLQTYTVNVSNYNTFTCTNGTKVIINPNAFLTQSGAAVTGVVNIEVKDVLSKKDMILNNAMPVSNGNLLVSGGEVYFNATQNGQKLKMNPSSSVRFNVPAGNNPSNQMLEFYSPGGPNLSTANLNWATNTQTILPLWDSSNTSGSWVYNLQSDSVTWTNCDYFYTTSGAKTTCTVNLSGSFDNTNTVVFLSMNGVNTMARLGSSSTVISQEFHSYVNSIPVGVNYTVIAISFDGTNYYYGSQSITMTANMVINFPTLTQTTQSQIATNLSTLP